MCFLTTRAIVGVQYTVSNLNSTISVTPKPYILVEYCSNTACNKTLVVTGSQYR